jgi:hypothetical protein
MPSLRHRFLCAFWTAGIDGLTAKRALRRTLAMSNVRRRRVLRVAGY